MRRSLHHDHDLHPGQVLGPYELLVPVGSGGMAHVWAARHRGADAVFALKMLMPHLAGNSAFRDMFFDEARIASRIRHENVARTFELVDLDGILTLVMEWVDGSSMIRMLRPGGDEHDDAPLVALPVRHAARIVAETCAGLHAAHELLGDDGRPLAVVHRDVSPHNVLLTLDGRVKVTDFGVAKAIGKSHMTIAGQVKGKLAYMSPEQLIGGGLDRRSDIFSLGSVLYESTTGQRPFQGEHDPQVMAAIVMGNVRPPSEIVRGYPKGLEEIVMRALSTEPEARFATALQLKQALERWLASSGPPIGANQISLLLQERCGRELGERMSALSITQPAMPPGPAAPTAPPAPYSTPASSSGPHASLDSNSTMEVDRRSPMPKHERSNGASALSMFIAVLVGAVLGLAVLVYVQNVRRARRLAADMAMVDAGGTTIAVTAPPSTSTALPTFGVVDAGAIVFGDLDDDVGTDAATSMITLRLPPGARLYVDGRPLPAGTETIARPTAGFVTVLVKAEAHQDAVVEITPTSPDEIVVTMLEKPKPRPRTTAPDPASTIAMPPNPYD